MIVDQSMLSVRGRILTSLLDREYSLLFHVNAGPNDIYLLT